MEWEGKVFNRRPRHPAFEIIFVYSQNDGTLDIFLPGDKKPIPDLQTLFAKEILGAELGPDPKDERVYDLMPTLSNDFDFQFDADSGIESVAVRKLKLKVKGSNEKIQLEADITENELAVYDLLARLSEAIPRQSLFVVQIGVVVTFTPKPGAKRASTRSFDISWPNSCSLKHDDKDLIIRKMLADSGIEPKAIASPKVEAESKDLMSIANLES